MYANQNGNDVDREQSLLSLIKLNKCAACRKTFKAKETLIRHLKKHTSERLFKCNVCSKKFVTTVELRCHSVTHTRAKRFKCDDCLQLFVLKTNYEAHQRRAYKCDICSGKFCTLRSLKMHMERHSGINKPYKCDQCLTQFYTRKHLKQHMYIHDKPYKCSVCEKLFARLYQLNTHKKKCNYNFVLIPIKENAKATTYSVYVKDTADTIATLSASKCEIDKVNSKSKQHKLSQSNTNTDFVSNEHKLGDDLAKRNPKLDFIDDNSQENAKKIKAELVDDGDEFDNIPKNDDVTPQNYELVSQLDIIEIKLEMTSPAKSESEN